MANESSLSKQLRTLRDLDVRHKKVLVRGDLNVPLSDNGLVGDEERVRRFIPTLRELSQRGARIILLSHLGRPQAPDERFSLRHILPLLEKYLAPISVKFVPDMDNHNIQKVVNEMNPGDVLLLENLRFFPGEEKNDPDFAQKIAALGDVYINDAFSVSHRSHASVDALPRLMKVKGIGLLMEEELESLACVLNHPKHPVMAIVGGAKINTKLGLLDRLIKRVDYLVLGGVMAVALKEFIKGSCQDKTVESKRGIWAHSFMKKLKKEECELVLPKDVVIRPAQRAQDAPRIVLLDEIPLGWEVVDIGPQTQERIISLIHETRTLLWNGPLGLYEVPPFDAGTKNVAEAISLKTQKGELISICGGGDTAAALVQIREPLRFTYVSGAGGAFLEYLEGKKLPGLDALWKK